MQTQEIDRATKLSDTRTREAADVLAFVQTATVETDAEAQTATTQIKALKEAVKEIETERRKLTDPLNAVVKQINAKFSPVVDLYERAEKILKGQIIAYQTAARKREAQAFENAAALAQAGDAAAATQALIAASVSAPAALGGVSTRTLWRARVVDVSQVPREYLIVNEKALAALATTTKGAATIPGVEFYAEESLAVRS